MKDRHYRVTHNTLNTELTVERHGRSRTYAIEFAPRDQPERGTASMIAVEKFLKEFNLAGFPVDQVREAWREKGTLRNREYCTKVRVVG